MTRRKSLQLAAVIVKERPGPLPLALTHIFTGLDSTPPFPVYYQSSFAFDDPDGFEALCRRTAELYAVQIRRTWRAVWQDGQDYYLEHRFGLTPVEAGLPGKWVLDGEL